MAEKESITDKFNRNLQSGFRGFVKGRARTLSYNRALQQSPYIPRAKKGNRIGPRQAGPGRPRGASGKYSIPGIGVVGVYEYRKWLNTQLQIQRLQERQQAQQNIQSYKQAYQRQLNNSIPSEQRTIPDTRGDVPTKNIHQEIDDAANIVP